MAKTPNYFQQRSDRNRAKEAKKLEKQRQRDEETAKRKAAKAETTREPGDGPEKS